MLNRLVAPGIESKLLVGTRGVGLYRHDCRIREQEMPQGVALDVVPQRGAGQKILTDHIDFI